MAKIINDSRGNALVDMRNKIPSDVVSFVKTTYGYDAATGRDLSTNAALTRALRELIQIKS
jgi:hypothetical protein